MTVDDTAATTVATHLDQSVARMLAALEGLTPEQLQRAPAAEEWPAVKLLAHVTEMMPYWAHQAAAVAARGAPDGPFGRTHDDPTRIAAAEAGAGGDAAALMAGVRAALVETERVLRRIPPVDWTRSGRHPRRGEMTVADVIEQFLVDHVREHANQAESIAASLRGAAT